PDHFARPAGRRPEGSRQGSGKRLVKGRSLADSPSRRYRRPAGDAYPREGRRSQAVLSEIRLRGVSDPTAHADVEHQRHSGEFVIVKTRRSSVVAAGKLKSTDGHYGPRFGHNTDATVTEFKKTKAQ